MDIAVIIPTLNEADILPRALDLLRDACDGARVEVVVSDCASRDATAAIAQARGARVVRGSRSRAEALNRGAAAAAAPVLVFLHADSTLPRGFARPLRAALARPEIVGGAFDFKFGSHPRHRGLNAWSLRLVQCANRCRFRWTHNFYGDQAIFARREVFDAIGGFPLAPLMEDIRFSRALKRRGRVAILRPAVKTSPRRFVSRGVLRQFATDLVLLACESAGLRPASMHAAYNRVNAAAIPGG